MYSKTCFLQLKVLFCRETVQVRMQHARVWPSYFHVYFRGGPVRKKVRKEDKGNDNNNDIILVCNIFALW